MEGSAVNIQIPITITPQSTRYRFDSGMPQRIGDYSYIIVEGDNPYIPWQVRTTPRRRRVILLADASGRQWLVELG